MSQPRDKVEIGLQCPVFDCNGNVDFICTGKAAKKRCDEKMGMNSVSGSVVPNCKIEGCPKTATFRCFSIDKNGDFYSFLSYVPGQGLFPGIHIGRDVELYAMKFDYKQFEKRKIDFYYDKVLKWIPKNQLLLPGFSFERIALNG